MRRLLSPSKSQRIEQLEADRELVIEAGTWAMQSSWRHAMQRLGRQGTTYHLLKLKGVDEAAYNNAERVIWEIGQAIEAELSELKS